MVCTIICSTYWIQGRQHTNLTVLCTILVLLYIQTVNIFRTGVHQQTNGVFRAIHDQKIVDSNVNDIAKQH